MRGVLMAHRSRRERSGSDLGSVPILKQRLERWMLLVLGLVVLAQAISLATHVWSAAIQHQWLFLVLGTLVYPVGVTHGMGVWFGWWK